METYEYVRNPEEDSVAMREDSEKDGAEHPGW